MVQRQEAPPRDEPSWLPVPLRQAGMRQDEQHNRAADVDGRCRERDCRQNRRTGGRPPANHLVEAEEPAEGSASTQPARRSLGSAPATIGMKKATCSSASTNRI